MKNDLIGKSSISGYQERGSTEQDDVELRITPAATAPLPIHY